MLTMLLTAWLAITLLMFLLWLIHFPIRNAAIVDVGWALGLAMIALIYWVMGEGLFARKTLITFMVVFWGVRLGLHLLFDRILGQEEEGRYQELREKWKTNISIKFLIFYQLQASLDVLLSLPFLLACLNTRAGITALEIFGFLVWCVAIAGESLADKQLKQFKADPANKGKVCQVGLWNYSRHPNYFFEWLVWMGYFLVALGAPYGWIAIVCPLLMLHFLFNVTGIPATEAHSVRSRGDAYREYQRTTSRFVPWFPKKSN